MYQLKVPIKKIQVKKKLAKFLKRDFNFVKASNNEETGKKKREEKKGKRK